MRQSGVEGSVCGGGGGSLAESGGVFGGEGAPQSEEAPPPSHPRHARGETRSFFIACQIPLESGIGGGTNKLKKVSHFE